MSDITDALRHNSSRSNTRIPPIVAARRRSSSSSSSSSGTSYSPPPTHIAALSRSKLHKETSARDPDLRRCLGHQRLLRQSVHLAQDDMQKAMISFQAGPDPDCASDSDSDDEDFDDYYLNRQHHPTSHPREGAPIREQIASAVKAMVRRKLSTSSTVTTTATAAAGNDDGGVPSSSDWAFASSNHAEVSAQPGKFETESDGGLSALGGILRTTTMVVSLDEKADEKGEEVEGGGEPLDVEEKENVEPLAIKAFGCPLQRQVYVDEQQHHDSRPSRKRRRFPLGRRLWSPNYELRARAVC